MSELDLQLEDGPHARTVEPPGSARDPRRRPRAAPQQTPRPRQHRLRPADGMEHRRPDRRTHARPLDPRTGTARPISRPRGRWSSPAARSRPEAPRAAGVRRRAGVSQASAERTPSARRRADRRRSTTSPTSSSRPSASTARSLPFTQASTAESVTSPPTAPTQSSSTRSARSSPSACASRRTRVVRDPPSYVTKTLGPRPADRTKDRAWVRAVVEIERYRLDTTYHRRPHRDRAGALRSAIGHSVAFGR